MSKIHFYNSVQLIDASIEEVYDYLTKNEHILSWSNMTKDHVYAEGEPLQYSYAGQKLQVIQEHRGKRYCADAWVENIEAPSFIDLRTSNEVGTMIGQYHLQSKQNQTELQIDLIVDTSKWAYAILYKLSRSRLSRMYNEEFQRLSDYAIQINRR
ncbi:SRPBCC domain-containing protein [Exiguobacterium sp. R-17]|uniref:SRPBCC domain-containing protein n=1 Tax=Exiguobacterium sp. R-17 TaxID=3404054 RepID=UPI003CF384CF